MAQISNMSLTELRTGVKIKGPSQAIYMVIATNISQREITSIIAKLWEKGPNTDPCESATLNIAAEQLLSGYLIV